MEKKDCIERISKLEDELVQLRECVDNERTFKTGDWVCFNHGEYPEHICREPWMITHWSYEYYANGHPQGRIHNSPKSGHEESCLRYAHPDEIEYYKSGLPYIYHKGLQEYLKVELLDGDTHFKIGDIIDTRTLSKLSPKELVGFLLGISENKYEYLSTIMEKLK
jgi:hypothetical protein